MTINHLMQTLHRLYVDLPVLPTGKVNLSETSDLQSPVWGGVCRTLQFYLLWPEYFYLLLSTLVYLLYWDECISSSASRIHAICLIVWQLQINVCQPPLSQAGNRTIVLWPLLLTSYSQKYKSQVLLPQKQTFGPWTPMEQHLLDLVLLELWRKLIWLLS